MRKICLSIAFYACLFLLGKCFYVLVIKVKFFFLKTSYTWNIPIKWTEDDEQRITLYNRSETGGKYRQLIYFFLEFMYYIK